MTKQATKAQIAAALKALGRQACPVESATMDSRGRIVLYLVPNPEPVSYKPSKTPRSGGGQATRKRTTKPSS